MDQNRQTTDMSLDSDYQKQLEEAAACAKSGQTELAEQKYQTLTAAYPQKFGAWWAYSRFDMERKLAQEPLPPYHEIDLESVMLTRALSMADNSQKLFMKQKIAEYKETWSLKCEECRKRTKQALKEFPSFQSFVHSVHEMYESAPVQENVYYKLLRHGRKELYFEKITGRDHGKPDIVKYTYSNWNEHQYRLTGVYDVGEFDLYVKDFDGEKLVLVEVFTEGKEQRQVLIELLKKG